MEGGEEDGYSCIARPPSAHSLAPPAARLSEHSVPYNLRAHSSSGAGGAGSERCGDSWEVEGGAGSESVRCMRVRQ